MNSLLRRRALAVIAGGAVALSTAVAVTPTATAAPNSEAAAVRWLEKSLTGSLAVYETSFGPFTDYGLSLDVIQALSDLGAAPATRAAILATVTENLDSYVTPPPSEWGYASGGAGKFTHTAIRAGANPRNVGSRDLVAELEDATAETGESEGTYGGVGQAWATRGLVAADSAEKAASAEFLASKQCDDGGFLQNYAQPCPSTIAVDATAFAVFALSEAKASGVAGLEDDIDQARTALLAAQGADGSFVGDGTPNTNSTGLAAQALDLLGEPAAATKAARWVAGHQLTDASATGKLAGNSGAIAYNQAAVAAGRNFGIDAIDLGPWLLASAQAAPALALLAGPARTAVAGPAFGAAGRTIKVAVAGLEPGWSAKAAVSGGATFTALVQANGRATFAVRLPKGTAKRTVTITDATGRKVGVKTVSVLGAKRLSPTMKKNVKRKKVQRVVVRGFAAGEPVQVRFRGKLVRTGKANRNGNVVRTFRVGTKLGKAKVVVRGMYANRKGVKTFRVVK